VTPSAQIAHFTKRENTVLPMKMPSPMRRWEDQLPRWEKTACAKACTFCVAVYSGEYCAGYYALSQRCWVRARILALCHAAPAIGVAVVADGLDAALPQTIHQRLWREFDSLADVITFGVAPALLAWMWDWPAAGNRGFRGA